MPTKTCSAFSPVSLVKVRACIVLLLSACAAVAAPEQPPPQISTQELEDLMLPPRGWKVDREVLSHYFWLMPVYLPGKEQEIVIHPFWPAYFCLELEEGFQIEKRKPGYAGAVGGLLTDGLNSPDPEVKRKTALWLRHSLLLYFAGIRLSTENDVLPYAPWIKKEDVRRLNLLTDHFLAGLKPIHSRSSPGKAVTPLKLEECLSNPGGKNFAAVTSYYDALAATNYGLYTTFVHPIGWMWLRDRGNKTLTCIPGYGCEIDATEDVRYILGNEPPPDDGPRGLWMRDVFLSCIVGKELLEGKRLPVADKAAEALLKDALQQWWTGLEKLK